MSISDERKQHMMHVIACHRSDRCGTTAQYHRIDAYSTRGMRGGAPQLPLLILEAPRSWICGRAMTQSQSSRHHSVAITRPLFPLSFPAVIFFHHAHMSASVSPKAENL